MSEKSESCCPPPSRTGKGGKYDLAVIGAGSAGFSAAITAADQGAHVALSGVTIDITGSDGRDDTIDPGVISNSIVEAALKKVEGVKKIEVSLAEKQAIVTYDDAKADVASLTKATTDAGFPSALAKEGG